MESYNSHRKVDYPVAKRPLPGIAHLSQIEKKIREKEETKEEVNKNDITSPDYDKKLAHSKVEQLFKLEGKDGLLKKREEIKRELDKINKEFNTAHGEGYDKLQKRFLELEEELLELEDIARENTVETREEKIPRLKTEIVRLSNETEKATGKHKDMIIEINKDRQEALEKELRAEEVKLKLERLGERFGKGIDEHQQRGLREELKILEEQIEGRKQRLREEMKAYQEKAEELAYGKVVTKSEEEVRPAESVVAEEQREQENNVVAGDFGNKEEIDLDIKSKEVEMENKEAEAEPKEAMYESVIERGKREDKERKENKKKKKEEKKRSKKQGNKKN